MTDEEILNSFKKQAMDNLSNYNGEKTENKGKEEKKSDDDKNKNEDEIKVENGEKSLADLIQKFVVELIGMMTGVNTQALNQTNTNDINNLSQTYTAGTQSNDLSSLGLNMAQGIASGQMYNNPTAMLMTMANLMSQANVGQNMQQLSQGALTQGQTFDANSFEATLSELTNNCAEAIITTVLGKVEENLGIEIDNANMDNILGAVGFDDKMIENVKSSMSKTIEEAISNMDTKEVAPQEDEKQDESKDGQEPKEEDNLGQEAEVDEQEKGQGYEINESGEVIRGENVKENTEKAAEAPTFEPPKEGSTVSMNSIYTASKDAKPEDIQAKEQEFGEVERGKTQEMDPHQRPEDRQA